MGYEEAMDYLKEQADRLEDERESVESLTAERDQLRAQLETASGNARHYADKCTALESSAAGLRRALEDAPDYIDHPMTGDAAQMLRRYVNAALAASPADHARRIKAEALREAVEEVRNDEAAQESAATTRGALLCIADRLEAPNATR